MTETKQGWHTLIVPSDLSGDELFNTNGEYVSLDEAASRLAAVEEERDKAIAISDLFITEVRDMIEWPYYDHERLAIQRMKDAFNGNPMSIATSREIRLMGEVADLQRQLAAVEGELNTVEIAFATLTKNHHKVCGENADLQQQLTVAQEKAKLADEMRYHLDYVDHVGTGSVKAARPYEEQLADIIARYDALSPIGEVK